MMSASGPVLEPKLVPAATMEDQEKMAGESPNPIVLGPVAFSSPDPVTDAQRMLPLEDGTSAYEAAEVASAERTAAKEGDYTSMKKEELVSLAGERDVDVEGLKKDEVVAKLQEDDAQDMKASDFKDRVNAATTQDELDEAAEFYSNSGREYASVDTAVEKKQKEIDDSGNPDDS